MSRKKVVDTKHTSVGWHRLVLLLVPFLLYIQTTGFDFSFHDDDMILLNNFQTLRNFNLKTIFFTDAWLLQQKIELYRPWQSFTFAIDNQLTGNKASGYHLHNVLIFCVGIQLFYLFIVSLGLGGVTSFVLSLLYGVHFLFAHTVSWIPARGDLYLFAFSMAALLAQDRFIVTRKPLFLVLSALSYFGALLSKESAVVLLPLMVLTGWWVWNENMRKPSTYVFYVLPLLFTVVYLWMRSQSIFESPNIFTASSFMYNLRVVPESVAKFFVPAFFSVMPAYDPVVTGIGMVLIVLVAAAAWWKRREVNMTLVGLGIAFFLLPLLPSMVYRPAFTRIAYDYLDHRMFFPGIGLLLIAFAVLLPLVRERNWSVNYAYGLAAAMAVFAFVNARHYKNYTAYYDNATRTNPHSGLAWMNYGTMLARENRYPEMFQKFDRALEVIPENIELRMKLADSYYTVKDYARMEEQCRAVIAINPAFAKAYFNMALVRAEQKQTDAALQLMQTAVDKSPSNADAFYYRGLINKTLGRNDAALKDFQHTASLNPDHSNAYMEQGMLFGNMGRYADALAAADRYVQLNPSDGKGYFYRGQSRCLLNDKTNGCADLQRALSLGVPDAQAKIDYYCR